jgi:hypothetical protein
MSIPLWRLKPEEVWQKQVISTDPESTTNPRRLVTPGHFFSDESEKTKLNWFLFEYALELELFIRLDKRLRKRLARKGVDDKTITEFCIHHAKQMKWEILDRVAGRTANVHIGYEPIEAFFPTIGDRLVDRILTRAGEAWESQVEACVDCPTRCISEKDRKAPMFDDPSYWE